MLKVYSVARLSTLLAVILDLLGLDTATRIDCQVSLVPASGPL